VGRELEVGVSGNLEGRIGNQDNVAINCESFTGFTQWLSSVIG